MPRNCLDHCHLAILHVTQELDALLAEGKSLLKNVSIGGGGGGGGGAAPAAGGAAAATEVKEEKKKEEEEEVSNTYITSFVCF